MLTIDVTNEAEAFALNNALTAHRDALIAKRLQAAAKGDDYAEELATKEWFATAALHRRVANAALALSKVR